MRKFGIEIEFTGSRERVASTLEQFGLSVVTTASHLGYNNTRWTVKRDGSVSNGGELVSPPLDFDDPEQRGQVDLAVKALQYANARPDTSAGIHVHVDASDLTHKQVANVGRFMFKFEDIIYRIASSGWLTIRSSGMSSYCKPLTEETAKKLCKVTDRDSFYRAWYGSVQAGRYAAGDQGHASRYCGLNLHSWVYRGTVEFRVFNSSLNIDRIQAYIALSVAIVQDAREGFRRSTGKAYRLGSMASGTVNEDSAFLRFQQIMRSNSRDTKVLMSSEDWKRVRMCWRDSRPQVRMAY